MTRIDTELVRSPKQWWLDHREVHLLLDWLARTGRILSLAEALDVSDKPKKWSREREEMLKEEARERLADEEEAFESERRYSL